MPKVLVRPQQLELKLLLKELERKSPKLRSVQIAGSEKLELSLAQRPLEPLLAILERGLSPEQTRQVQPMERQRRLE
jgi:hypothetical protein